jgi:DNA-binding transcriptional LysR family regulator
MNTRQLECFIAVAENLSFTKASEKIFISQTAVTQQIQKLELQLNVKLFERTNRNVKLTTAGATFLHEAKAILEREKDAITKTQLAANGFSGNLRIGWIKGYEMSNFVEYIRNFHSKFPNISLSFSRQNMGVLHSMLENDELDIIFTIHFNIEHYENITFKTIDSFSLYAVLAPFHPFAHKLSIKRIDLKNDPVILAEKSKEDTDLNRFIINQYDAAGFIPENILATDDLETILFMVAVGMGTAVLPSYAISQFGSWDHLVTIPLEDEHPAEIIAAWRKNNTNPSLNKLIEMFK